MGWFDNIMVHQIRPCKIDWNSQGVIKLSFDFIDMKHIFFLNFLEWNIAEFTYDLIIIPFLYL